MTSQLQKTSDLSVARVLAEWIESVEARRLPVEVVRACESTLIDTLGLGFAACNEGYVNALRESWRGEGACTVLGESEKRDSVSAAMINGTAAHGEDFDNTFEGCPIHSGAVVVPAVLAAAEAYGLTGRQALKGLVVGIEVMCRLGLVVQRGVHTAGFHPTGVLGAMAATAGIASACNLPSKAIVNAWGIAGSMAGGLIEYLSDGTWTKRMHAGWAAQSGLRAVAMARAGFTGPATVFEGRHGLMHGFAPSVDPDFSILTSDLSEEWWASRVAFKRYACGTMAQPFVDCAIRLSKKVSAEEVKLLVCSVGEGTVHRLWEPLEDKRRPPNAYAAKFSTPYCVAVGFLRGDAGLAEFTDESVCDKSVLDLAQRVSYEIDPDDEYPQNYTGRIRASLLNGSEIEEFQPYLCGGSRSPMSRDELLSKCSANLRYGGFAAESVDHVARFSDSLTTSDGIPDVSLLELKAI
ncbi:MAG: MmgE/PrpD family protein [Pseudomonadota bacterium]|nr:MmgE/PrpD family protein [Pseudomonadota bacterium]